MLVMLTGLNSCDLLDFHPYDGRFDGPKDINARNIARIESATLGRDSIVFAVISDTQRWYDETHDAVNSINARPEIDFVIHCGDLTDFSATREFEWMRDELERLAMPYVCLIGNHDCLANGPRVFQTMFGTPNSSFNAGDTHFICLDTRSSTTTRCPSPTLPLSMPTFRPCLRPHAAPSRPCTPVRIQTSLTTTSRHSFTKRC